MLESMTENVVICSVDLPMYVAESRAKKHVIFVELIGSTECRIL